MKKIEAIIRPSKMEDIKEALSKFGIQGLTVSQVTGCGLQKGYKEVYRGVEYSLNLIQKIKIEIVTEDEMAENIVKILMDVGRTGEIGDGKIFIYDVADVIKIRTGERGKSAI